MKVWSRSCLLQCIPVNDLESHGAICDNDGYSNPHHQLSYLFMVLSCLYISLSVILFLNRNIELDLIGN